MSLVVINKEKSSEATSHTVRWESHGLSCHSSEPPEEARKPQLSPAVFTFPSRGKWWLPGNLSMVQLCAACSMRITGYLVEQCHGYMISTYKSNIFNVICSHFIHKIVILFLNICTKSFKIFSRCTKLIKTKLTDLLTLPNSQDWQNPQYCDVQSVFKPHCVVFFQVKIWLVWW